MGGRAGLRIAYSNQKTLLVKEKTAIVEIGESKPNVLSALMLPQTPF